MKAHPFLRWVGGKTQLLPELLKRAPAQFGSYHETFLGGGSMFFALRPKRAILSDANADLVGAYRVVRDHVGELVERIACFAAKHCEQQYYDVRSDFNSKEGGEIVNAARMIYLNKTCFNGLYRVNKSGGFNSSIGTFKSPQAICDGELFRACSEALQGVDVRLANFGEVEIAAKAGDFVYFDPPYVPASSTANFTAYTKKGFGPSDQLQLAQMVGRMKAGGVHVLVSNAGDEATVEMYRQCGLSTEMVTARRSINCSAGKRGPVADVLAT